MILKVQPIDPLGDGTPRILAHTQGKVFKYEGVVGPDIVEMLAGRDKMFVEASMGPEGLEIGDEVPDPGW
jgi:hypothetical protein